MSLSIAHVMQSEIKDKAMLQKFCTCMQMPLNVVEKALTSRLFAGGNRASTYSVPLTRDQAVEGRDAFAKVRSRSLGSLVA